VKLKEFVNYRVETVAPGDTLQCAAEKMKELDIGSLPVCDTEKLPPAVPFTKPGKLGVVWGFDLGLLFTTQKVVSLIWVAIGYTSMTGMDNYAHLGGFAFGIPCGLILENRHGRNRPRWIAAVAAANAPSIDFQTLATAYGNYTKKSFEETKAFVEKLSGARSLDKAVEIQIEFAKQAYETFVTESQKIRELYRGLAKETYKPFEGFVARKDRTPR